MHDGIRIAVESWAQTTTLQGEALRCEVVAALDGSIGRMPELLSRPAALVAPSRVADLGFLASLLPTLPESNPAPRAA